jgi:hypothetical protein
MTAHGTVVLLASGWRRLGRLREGDEGGAGRAGPEWPGGPNATWAGADRKKREMGRKDDWDKMIFGLR